MNFDFIKIIESHDTIFNGLDENEKAILNKLSSFKEFKKNELIFKEGETPSGLLFLVKGKVKVYKKGIGGRGQIVRLSKPYGFIGYRALFAEENYNGSALALEHSVICHIGKKAIYQIIESDKSFAFKLIRSMATELGLANTKTVTLTQKHIRGRLAESLIFIAETYGFEKDGSTINAPLSREDLANLSNMTTSNAIRTLSAFADEEVVQLVKKKIKILNYNKLKHISDLG